MIFDVNNCNGNVSLSSIKNWRSLIAIREISVIRGVSRRESRWAIININNVMSWIMNFNNMMFFWVCIVFTRSSLILGHDNANYDDAENAAECSSSSAHINSA